MYLLVPKYMVGRNGSCEDPYDYPPEEMVFGDWTAEFERKIYERNEIPVRKHKQLDIDCFFAVGTLDGHGHDCGLEVEHIYGPAPKEFVLNTPVWVHATSRDVIGDLQIIDTGLHEGDRLGVALTMGMPDDAKPLGKLCSGTLSKLAGTLAPCKNF